ncbi:MAG: PAS domain-containing protein [Ginsengibacter sp.]
MGNSIQFLKGGGEMGALTRTKNWSQTPLGNPESWPQSLCTALGILLHSKFPMFLWWGPDLICFYNDAYRPSLGTNGKHPSILGMKAEQAWPEIWELIKPLIDNVLTGGEGTWSEDQLIPIYRNGKIEDVYWTFSYSPVMDEFGKPGGVLVTCTETTDKVNTLKLLKESNDQLQFAIEATELGTWDLDPDTNKFTGNKRLKDWYGLPAKEELELSLALAVIAKNDRQRVIDAIRYAMQFESGGNYDIEFTIVHPETGRERIVRAKGKAWFNSENACFRFNGTLQDITTQSISNKKIEESEKRFRRMAETIPEIAWAASPDGPYSFYNKRFYEYTGMSVDEAARDWKWKTIVHPDMFEKRNQVWKCSLETGEDFYFESLLKRNSDQAYRWHISRATAIKNEKGEITLWVGTSSDIHDQKLFSQELERQVNVRTKALAETITHLENSNENLEQFASIASHDLQEPLRKIQTFTTLLKKRHQKDFPEAAKILIDKIKNAAARMSVLISDVLNFSRITQSQYEFVNTDLNKIFADVLKDFELVIQERKVIIHQEGLPTIEAIPVQINQVLYNLLGNSMKFTINEIQPVINVSSKMLSPAAIQNHGLHPSYDYYEIVYNDNGIGFDPQFAEDIFLIFHRLNDPVQYSGTGIGLALCRKIVINHHGKIYAESKKNKGASFYIILPAKQSYFLV